MKIIEKINIICACHAIRIKITISINKTLKLTLVMKRLRL